jgi:hypothetical protein
MNGPGIFHNPAAVSGPNLGNGTPRVLLLASELTAPV